MSGKVAVKYGNVWIVATEDDARRFDYLDFTVDDLEDGWHPCEFDLNEEALYREAIALWGRDIQIVMAMEECAELIQQLSKFLRKGVPPVGLVDELVDVQLMLNQMKTLVPAKDYLDWYQYKQERLRERMEEWKEKNGKNTPTN